MLKSGPCFLSIIIFFFLSFFAYTAHASKFKVLALMSYEQDFAWCKDIKQGIDSVLEDSSEIKYFYMDTKKDIKNGPEKAKQAYELYNEFQPDGVIAADDNAQFMFVVPFLQNKVKTPVMFCGVNAEPEKYGYPSSNVSGILERYHINESIAFAKQLVPSVKTIGFLGKYSPTALAGFKQVQKEKDTYPVKYIDFKMPKTIDELELMTKELKEKCDLLLLLTIEGIQKKDKTSLSDKEGIPVIAKIFNKPLIGVSAFQADYGVLCTVINTGQEQGSTAAKKLLKAMKGTKVTDIPISRNYKGRRLINVTILNELGIKPRPEILRGAKLVRTEQ